MTRYWIDTDPGVDDALALLLALREGGSALIGCSTVQGNVDELAAARNLSRLLTTYAARGLTPASWAPTLARGSRLPLAGGRALRATATHGSTGLGTLAWEAAPPWDHYVSTFAAQAIVDAAAEMADLHLLCIGPLTNLALALRIDPDLPAYLGRLTIMGGSLRAGGNETMAAEFNFAADPEAARIVLEAGFPRLDLVPLDGCLTARMMPQDVSRIAALGSVAAQTAKEILDQWANRIARNGQALYDALAWLTCTHPTVATWESVYVTVDTGRDVAHGASLADWRGRSGRAPNVRVAMAVDRAAVLDVVCELLR